MAETRTLRRITTKSRGDDTRNLYRRYQLRDGKEEAVPAGRRTAYVVILTHKGRQFRRYASTQAAAIRERDQLRQLLRDGINPDGQAVTFADYSDGWIKRYKGKSGGIRAETKREYESELALAKAHFSGMRLSAIKRKDAEDYIEHVRRERGRKLNGTRQPAADSTIRNAIAPLRALFFDALQNEVVRSNPFSRIPVSAVVEEEDANTHTGDEEQIRKALEPEELRRFLLELAAQPELREGQQLVPDWKPGYWPLLGEFLAQTGLRISEAVALRWRDVDLDAPAINVQWRIYRGKRGRPKSMNGRRLVPLSPGVASRLRELRGTTTYGKESDPVFASSAGTHLDPGNIYSRVFKPAFNRAGVPWAAFHSLRHTAASFYFRATKDGGAGANIKQVSSLLGHHDPGFTLATYVHLFNDEKLPDASAFDVLVEMGQETGHA